jgi:hypothetical protein
MTGTATSIRANNIKLNSIKMAGPLGGFTDDLFGERQHRKALEVVRLAGLEPAAPGLGNLIITLKPAPDAAPRAFDAVLIIIASGIFRSRMVSCSVRSENYNER